MRRALGKGLSQLIAEQIEPATNEVPIDAISPNLRQPRTHFDEQAMEELAASIRTHGVLQPLLVRPLSESTYELIAGERRLRAAKLAGLATVPVVVRTAGGQESLELALIENLQREDINPMECARAYRKLVDEFGLSQDQVADKVGKSRSGVANILRLLRLAKPIQQALEAGEISEGHARALLACDDLALQLSLFERVRREKLSVRETERLVKTVGGQAFTPLGRQDSPQASNPAYVPVQEALSTFFATPVQIEKSKVGGRITLEFYSDDDLERILEAMGFRL